MLILYEVNIVLWNIYKEVEINFFGIESNINTNGILIKCLFKHCVTIVFPQGTDPLFGRWVWAQCSERGSGHEVISTFWQTTAFNPVSSCLPAPAAFRNKLHNLSSVRDGSELEQLLWIYKLLISANSELLCSPFPAISSCARGRVYNLWQT